ncbi:MAG: hypothetical protein ACJA0Z_002010 [Halioglobus sp.]
MKIKLRLGRSARSFIEFPISYRLSIADNFKFQPIFVLEIETTPRFVIGMRMWLKTCRYDRLLGCVKIINYNAEVIKTQ